jgi:hypothetical protein
MQFSNHPRQESCVRRSKSRVVVGRGAWICRAQRAGLILLACTALLAACERPTHENIDHWLRTEKGPDKLAAAVRDPELAADLRAHAGQNLIRLDQTDTVLALLEELPAAQRQAVLAALIPRLWQDARISGALTRPSADQVAAKDALFELRRLADGERRLRVDAYLLEWLADGYYAGRAGTGRAPGAAILRAIGRAAGPKMVAATRAVVDAPADATGARFAVEPELLLGLAATGSPEAAGHLLELVGRADRDPELPRRALSALHAAYVDSGQRFEPCDGGALVPHLARLAAVAGDEALPVDMRDQAIALIGAAGPPACIEALVPLIAGRHRNEMVRWVSANAALRCGKAQAIVPVAEALPVAGAYEASKLQGVLWEPMAALDDRDKVAAQARILLESASWVARIIGVELLGHLALPGSAAADAERVRALSGDRTTLRGWWGEQRELPARDRKQPPRLGERATSVANALDELAKSGRKS